MLGVVQLTILLGGWIMYTIAYIKSSNLECDVALRAYYWITTMAFVMTVLHVYSRRLEEEQRRQQQQERQQRRQQYEQLEEQTEDHGDDAENDSYNSGDKPCMAGLGAYAAFVFWIGMFIVPDPRDPTVTCSQTAPELYQAANRLFYWNWNVVLFSMLWNFGQYLTAPPRLNVRD